MAFGFWRERINKKNNKQTTDDRHQNDQRAPGAGRCQQVCIIINGKDAVKGDVMNKRDKRTENNRAVTCDHTDHKCQHTKT